MLVVADESIPYVREVFATLAGVDEVRTVAGREMSAESVRDAELLLVRSATKVGRDLLDGSRVRFVGTATIGTDHADLDWLRSKGIAFASAPGSNARSVAEYVAAALLVLESRGLTRLGGATLGVVGVGEVGSRVVKVAEALGMKTLLNDPPRARREGPGEGPGAFVPLDQVAGKSDVVTFHVPLERTGPDPTFHLVDARFLAELRRGVVVMNSSRGAVADTAALADARRNGRLGALVMDVWENEPAISRELLDLTGVATPHVAGYSFDGKVAGTRMVYEAACRFLGEAPAWPDDLPPRADLVARLERPSVLDAVRASYDVEADDARMREALTAGSAAERAAAFDGLRRTYPVRREFRNWRVELAGGAAGIGPTLRALGFQVEGDAP
jgi:erythronate-4-phosphate dehydrogenase